ncbi:MAG: glycosyltransferase family 4 protein [Candidatus Heimdallarchaeum endolithica]|uniref:Glycosyltransferase family 4 protein n=1 Tax=Candidatus Heimdallarchaeum endolithica TaxID=2876572 RepID=A0A9Y1FPE3_9ARCH|nr:MAG: glycosyltransferase family 4 protein [Candidatus Heimdallarchaeum endolithica]
MEPSVFLSVIEVGPPYVGSLAGTRRYAYSLINSLSLQGINITVVSTNKLNSKDPLLEKPNVKFYYIKPRKERKEGYRKNIRSIKRESRYFSKKSLEFFLKLQQQQKFHLIHTIDFASLSFIKAKKEDKIILPIIASISNPIIAYFLKKEHIECVDQVIYTNNKSKEKSLKLFPNTENRSIVIPLSIDCTKFSQIPKIEDIDKFTQKYDLHRDKDIILILGPFIPRKMQKELIPLFPKIIQKNSNSYFLFCGEGPTLTSIKEKIISYRLEDYLSFTGYVSEEELYIAYYISSVLIYPAESGSFGTPIIEALASGLPVIAADKPPMNEIVSKEYLYSIENKEQIVDIVVSTIEKRKKEDISTFDLQKDAIKEHHHSLVGKKILKLYEKVIE